MSTGYKINDQEAAYYLTLQVVGWIDVFTELWNHENHAEQIFTDMFLKQKLEYIHLNQVRAGIVRQPEDYIYSSASNYAGLASILDVEIVTTKWKTY